MSTVRVLAKVRDVNGIQEKVEWLYHHRSTFRIECGNVVIYGLGAAGRPARDPAASYPPGEYTHVEVVGSEHNPQS